MRSSSARRRVGGTSGEGGPGRGKILYPTTPQGWAADGPEDPSRGHRATRAHPAPRPRAPTAPGPPRRRSHKGQGARTSHPRFGAPSRPRADSSDTCGPTHQGARPLPGLGYTYASPASVTTLVLCHRRLDPLQCLPAPPSPCSSALTGGPRAGLASRPAPRGDWWHLFGPPPLHERPTCDWIQPHGSRPTCATTARTCSCTKSSCS